jgi:SulP family sulfate permease
MANTIGSFFSGYVVSSSFNRSALNYAVGARTPLSAIFAGVMLIGIISVAAPLAAYLPYAAMGASLYLIGWGLIDRRNIAQIAKTSRTEAVILIATFLAALFIHVQFAILAGVALSLIVFLYRTSKPQIHIRVPDPQNFSRKFTDTRPDLPECKQIRLIRIDGSLFFGAVNSFKETLLNYEVSAPQSRHLLIVMQGVNFIDVAGAEVLAQMSARYQSRGGGLYLIRPKENVLELLERGGYMDDIGRQNVFFSKTTALRTVYRHLDYDVCRSCSLRVYVECARMGKQEPLEDDEDEAPAYPPVTSESMSGGESKDTRLESRLEAQAEECGGQTASEDKQEEKRARRR